MFVLTVEDGTVECGLKLVDGGFCNMVGDLLSVFGPGGGISPKCSPVAWKVGHSSSSRS